MEYVSRQRMAEKTLPGLNDRFIKGFFMRLGKSVALAAALCLTAASVTPAAAQSSMRRKQEEKSGNSDLLSAHRHRSAVREPVNRWWEGLGLESPKALLEIFVQRSGCFTLVDRGKGFEMAQQERALAAGGALQGGSNIGGGRVTRRGLSFWCRTSFPRIPMRAAPMSAACWGASWAALPALSFRHFDQLPNRRRDPVGHQCAHQRAASDGRRPWRQDRCRLQPGRRRLRRRRVRRRPAFPATRTPPSARWSCWPISTPPTKLVGQMGGLSANAKADAPAARR